MRWRIAKLVFLSAGIVLVFAVSSTAFGLELLPGRYLELLLSLVPIVATTLLLDVLQRYPKVSIGKTTIFFYTLFAIPVLIFVFASNLMIKKGVVVPALAAIALVFFSWTAIDRYVRRKKFLVVPTGSAKALVEMLGGRFGFDVMDQPDIDATNLRAYDGIVIDTKSYYDDSWRAYITAAKLRNMPIYPAHVLVERYSGRLVLSHVNEVFITQLEPSFSYQVIKRALDILVVIVTLPLVLLLVAVLSLIIRIESPGPVIFRQKRVGEGEKTFTIYKFRSMLENAEEEGPRFAHHEDDRVTRIGRFIRQFRLDELPQFLNILRGEMSLIGPRPEQVQMAQHFKEAIPLYSYRHLVKPGITGWAQVTHGYTADMSSTEIKLEHDLYYIKHFSIWLDLLIGVKTIRTILTGFGAR